MECYDSGTLYGQDTETDALKNGDVDYIFSAPKACKMTYKGITVNGIYAVVRNGKVLIKN